MKIVGDIGDEIIGDITCVRHPGFFNNSNWGSQGVPDHSKAYLRDDEKHRYLAGGFQGGQTDKFLEVSRILADNIDYDYNNGYIAPHNDETHWNCFMNKIIYERFPEWKITELDPSYCMLPNEDSRISFGLAHLSPKILALEKNHEELRN